MASTADHFGHGVASHAYVLASKRTKATLKKIMFQSASFNATSSVRKDAIIGLVAKIRVGQDDLFMTSQDEEGKRKSNLLEGVMYQSIPKPPIPPGAIPGHLTRVKLRTVGNLTQNEARPVGHLTRVKTSVNGRKQKDFAIL